jgi:hypothetical protein
LCASSPAQNDEVRNFLKLFRDEMTNRVRHMSESVRNHDISGGFPIPGRLHCPRPRGLELPAPASMLPRPKRTGDGLLTAEPEPITEELHDA